MTDLAIKAADMPEWTERLLRLEIGHSTTAEDIKEIRGDLKEVVSEIRAARHEQANRSMATDKRIEGMERVINGDPSRDRPPLDKRVENMETVLMSGRAMWKLVAGIGAALLALGGGVGWALQYVLPAKH